MIPALRISLLYALFSVLWILLSDFILARLVRDAQMLTQLQTFKGWFFVLISAGLIFTLLQREIDERDRVQKNRLESEERYRILVQQASDGIFITDLQGNYVDVNPRACEILGHRRDEILGLNIRDFLHPEDLQENAPRQDELWDGKTHLTEHRLRRKDGDFVHLEVSSRKMADGRILSIARDISKRKQTEKALRTWAEIFQHTKVGIAISDPDDSRLKLVNQALAVMHGYSVEELTGRPIEDIVAPEERPGLGEQIGLAQQRGHHIFEARHLRKDGAFFPALIDVTEVHGEGQEFPYRIINVQDISERKRSEVQIQKQLQRLSALRAIDLAITATLDKRITFSVVLDQLATQLNVDAAAVLLYDPVMERLEYAAGRGFLSNEIQGTVFRIGEGLGGRVIQTHQVEEIRDLTVNPEQFNRSDWFNKEGFVVYIGVPLIAKGEIKGVLETFHRSPLPVDADWMSFLEALAGQAAIALENASLYENLQRSSRELSLAYDATLEGWSRALELRDQETEGHSRRVTELTLNLAKALGLKDNELIHLRRGTLLHDIGKMGVPDSILLKPGPLTPEEWEIMRRHPVYAFEMIAPISFLRPALDIPYAHHERWDGSGYPRGLKAEQIPLSARIFAVVDVWDALHSERPYRHAWSIDRIRKYLGERAGTQFDPKVVDKFLAMLSEA